MLRTTRHDAWIALVVLAALLLAAVPAMLGRGPWYDEFYSLYAADPALGLADGLRQRWLPDNHPPLFYALSRATAWLGDSVAERRFVNLFILGGFVAGFAVLWHSAPALRRWGASYAIALASLGPAVLTLAELRSNFLVYAGSALLLAALASVAAPGARPAGRAGWVVLALAMVVACNSHFTATVICGCIGAAFGAWALLRRDWRLALQLAACAALAAVPFLAITALQFSGIEQNTRSFWIPAGFDAGRWTIQRELIAHMLANPALSVLGAMGMGFLACATWRERRLGHSAQMLLVLAAGAGLALAVLLALHLWRPIIIGRYLIALAPVVALALALGTSVLLARVAPLLRLAALAVLGLLMVLSLIQHQARALALPSWDGTGARIARLLADCPAAPVHPALHWNAFTLELPPVDNRQVVPFAYRHTAARHGFAVEPVASRRVAADCPTLFWAEHVSGQNPYAAAIVAQLRAQGYAVSSGRLERIGDGWVLIARR